jgi:hypothetical protein
MSTPTAPAARPAIWAESGTKVEPDTGTQQSGFVAGKPGRGKTNWLLNWVDNAIQWLLVNVLYGIINYDAGKDYAVGARVQDPSTHLSYQCLVANGPDTGPGVKALSDGTYWKKWGHDDAAVGTLAVGALGTLSGEVSSGITASASAVITKAQTFNMPATTEKMLIFTCQVPISSGFGSTLITLAGAAAFANDIDNASASLMVQAGSVVTGSTPKFTCVPVPGSNEIGIDIHEVSGTVTSMTFCVIATGH